MRQAILAWLLPAVLTAVLTADMVSPSRSSGEQTFPYKAFITADNVYVRSGPGKTYYPTDKLRSGQMVEVYRHDPGGWCAIRPPKGSYSWVATRYLRSMGDGLAEVTSPRTAARIGSSFSEIRDVILVRLNQNETVETLDDLDHAGDRPWTRIAPPSGEFRWVHADYLDPQYPTDGVRRSVPDENAMKTPPPGEPLGAGNARPTQKPRQLSPEAYQKRLEEINLELSIMVAEEPSVWEFDRMALDAEHLLAQADTALERGRTQLLLNKINQFENIKQRYDAVNIAMTENQRRDQRLAALSGANNANRPSSSRFDGEGRLTRVQSVKPGTPRYALVDESGRIKCYVTPSPGMNLRYYEQRTVGVTGARGYTPDQQAENIMAKHIDILGESHMR